MTEAQFQSKVIKFLNDHHIYHVKVWGGGYQRAGIPDILACVNGHFVGIELKTEVGRTSKLQDYNISRIRESKGTAIVLRPSGFEKFKEWIRGEMELRREQESILS
ncbi:Holliday junction resolvase [Fontibacillus solani]|uniref:Holliday junction resolvase n=1 Tax=Fontibacillus solani TaxID=1572857 RepID=A0A7W3SZ33_9BACL|nr:VRR-NUC domain-containing protein [Fontibacillus solani]MBA9088784.1 Holliday junction resolvase [Fontibacillus solani]